MFEMLFIRDLKPTLNKQKYSIAQSCFKIFVYMASLCDVIVSISFFLFY